MILLGVTGSIAAYKAVELLRLWVKAGQDVRVLMTEAATRFVGALTFQGLSGHPVLTDTLDPKGWQMAHLELPEKASALVIAPATAQILALLAMGAAGDIITTSALAMPRDEQGKLKAPVFVAPAMHEEMWLHPATQANVKTLKEYGYRFIGPEKGPLGRAGDKGLGRMTSPTDIAHAVLETITKQGS
jgi:phosphopantothenoylcysteine decarboxylase/phosphopantothenate--cysteine ligase